VSAQKRAGRLGVPWRTVDELSSGPANDCIKRVSTPHDRDALESETEVAALLGAEKSPQIQRSNLLDEFGANILRRTIRLEFAANHGKF